MGRLSTTECTYLPTYLYKSKLKIATDLEWIVRKYSTRIGKLPT